MSSIDTSPAPHPTPSSTSATTPPDRTALTIRVPGWVAVLRSEWTKLWTVRSTWATLTAAVTVGVGLSALLSFAATTSFADHPVQGQARFDAADSAVFGMNLALIAFCVLGVGAVAAEYASGMLTLTLTVTPRRGRVLLAKAALVAVGSFVTGAVSALAAFVLGQAIFAGQRVPTAALTDPGVLPALLGWGATATGFGLIAMAIGVLTRSAAAAIATTIGLIFAPMLLGALLPDWVRRDIIAYLPANAGTQLSTALTQTDSPTYLPPLVAAAVLTGWVLVGLVAAHQRLSTRDGG